MNTILARIHPQLPCLLVLILSIIGSPITLAAESLITPLTFLTDLPEATDAYLRQAEINVAPIKQDLLIKAAMSAYTHGDLIQTQAIIADLQQQNLNSKQIAETNLLSAQLALDANNTQQAVNLLYAMPPYLPYPLMVAHLDLLAQCFTRMGEHLHSIEQRLTLANKLKDDDAKSFNAALIWQNAQQIPDKQIQSLLTVSQNQSLKAWLSLTHIKNELSNSPNEFQAALQQWQTDYPNHPALSISQLKSQLQQPTTTESVENRQDNIANTSRFNFRNPFKAFQQEAPNTTDGRVKIAILLPQSGDMKEAAHSIQQGIMQGYYQEAEDKRPTLQFFDTTPGAAQAYERALQQGANFVIGPLLKDDVLRLYQGRYLKAPTLLLNTLPYNGYRHYGSAPIYQFSLSNEMEASQVARRAYQDGRLHALVIKSNQEWSNKMVAAFNGSYQRFGGRVIEQLAMNQNRELSKDIQKLLQYIENPPNNTPSPGTKKDSAFMNDETALESEKIIRHRTDVDMIFLAIDGVDAELVIPLLKFYYAQDIPVYTTSIINSQSIGEKRDLDGALFCEMPWIISKSAKALEFQKSVNHLWPNSTTALPRLYAFGLDAYQLARTIHNKDNTLIQGIPGYTGKLVLGDDQIIYRELPWAKFKNGQYQRLDKTKLL